ncbi:MAG: DivIVA domain-containing protein [Candidatus Nanopelagicales bacterium]|nr:DivIVA domain-containing protein [Candidatus Nanopelagicales bacterium]MDZ4249603.1 DivIVA domain-containing protein [Candidatus Nanopelagicales bacterium]MDZ7577629.1 DivIVA domain-containing protein [Candidatus Nanopelagicales bacterium]
MSYVFVLLGLIVTLGAALVLLGRIDATPRTGRPAPQTFPPDGGWTAESVERLKFRVVLRGYRMDEVDSALASMAQELRSRTAELELAAAHEDSGAEET